MLEELKIEEALENVTSISDGNAITLDRLDVERVFMANYFIRLESEIDKIKKQLKLT